MGAQGRVFPAYAGMIRSAAAASTDALGVPRLRGDDPTSAHSQSGV